MPFAELDPQTRVHFTVDGAPAAETTPDLVLVHGTGGSAVTNWAHLIEPLGGGPGGGRRVIAVDYAGSGRTQDAGGALEVSALATQVRAAIDAAGGRSFDLLGFSLGAVVAAHLAAEDPQALRRLVLLSGWARSADDARLSVEMELWRRLFATDQRALAQLLLLTGYSPGWVAPRPARALEQAIEQTVATLAPGFARQAELDARVDLTAQLPRITAPTLVLGAAHDQMIPAHHSQALAREIPGAIYDELPTGHLSLFEAPAALAGRVRAFLDD